jgi:PIN domain nuclease of toxin-antitoxin system
MIGLLDTNTLLWAVVAHDKLSAKMRGVMADPGNEIHVSSVSFWEIALTFSIGKLEMTGRSSGYKSGALMMCLVGRATCRRLP